MDDDASEIDLKFDQMDHILDQIANYTNQGKAQIFIQKEKTVTVPTIKKAYTPPTISSRFKRPNVMTDEEKLASNHVFRGHPYNIKY